SRSQLVESLNNPSGRWQSKRALPSADTPTSTRHRQAHISGALAHWAGQWVLRGSDVPRTTRAGGTFVSGRTPPMARPPTSVTALMTIEDSDCGLEVHADDQRGGSDVLGE